MSDLALTRDVPTLVGRGLRMSVRNVDGFITAVALPVMLLLMFVVPVRRRDQHRHRVRRLRRSWRAARVRRLRCSDDRDERRARPRKQHRRPVPLDGCARRVVGLRPRGRERHSQSFLDGAGVRGRLCNRLSLERRSGALAGGARACCAHSLLALSFLAAASAPSASSSESANGMSFAISFLAYPSSAFVPLASMPHGCRASRANQPETPVIDSIRDFLNGTPAWFGRMRSALLWSVGISVVSVAVGGIFYRRRTAG